MTISQPGCIFLKNEIKMNPRAKIIRKMAPFNSNPKVPKPIRSFYRFPKLPAEVRQITLPYAITRIPPRKLTITGYYHYSNPSLLKHDFLSKGCFPRIADLGDSDLVVRGEIHVSSFLQTNSKSRTIARENYRLRRVAAKRNHNALYLV
jgi:hypothetical protein